MNLSTSSILFIKYDKSTFDKKNSFWNHLKQWCDASIKNEPRFHHQCSNNSWRIDILYLFTNNNCEYIYDRMFVLFFFVYFFSCMFIRFDWHLDVFVCVCVCLCCKFMRFCVTKLLITLISLHFVGKISYKSWNNNSLNFHFVKSPE